MQFIDRELGNMEGSSQVYEKLLKFGKEKHVCNACTRHMDDRELAVFERHVRHFLLERYIAFFSLTCDLVPQLKEQIRKGSSDAKARAQEEEAEWTQELARLQLLTPLEVSKNRIQRADLPALEDQVMNLDTSIPAMSEHAEEVCQAAPQAHLVSTQLRRSRSAKGLLSSGKR
jgi:DNA repair protein RAD50